MDADADNNNNNNNNSTTVVLDEDENVIEFDASDIEFDENGFPFRVEKEYIEVPVEVEVPVPVPVGCTALRNIFGGNKQIVSYNNPAGKLNTTTILQVDEKGSIEASIPYAKDLLFNVTSLSITDIASIYTRETHRILPKNVTSYMVKLSPECSFPTTELPKQIPIPNELKSRAFMYSNDTSVAFLTHNTDFYMIDVDLMAYKKVATGVIYVLHTKRYWALICKDTHVIFVDGTGKIINAKGIRMPMKNVYALENMFVVHTQGDCLLLLENGKLKRISCLDSNVKEVIPTRNTVTVLTQSGHVWIYGNKANGAFVGVDKGFIPDLKKVVQVVRTIRAGAALTQNGKVFAWGDPMYGGAPDCGFVKNLPPVSRLLNTMTSIIAVTGQGDFYAWSNAWFKLYNSGIECAKACLINIPMLKSQNVAKIYACKTSWLIELKSKLFLSLGDMIANGPVRGLESVDIKTVYNNDFSFALINTKGQLFVIGAPSYGGANEKGNPGLVDTSGVKVTSVIGNKSMFVAVLENNNVMFWGGFSDPMMQFATLGITSKITNLLFTQRNDLYLALTNGLIYFNLEVLFDGHSSCPLAQFAYNVEIDDCAYALMFCGDESFITPESKCSGFGGDGCYVTNTPSKTKCPVLNGTTIDKTVDIVKPAQTTTPPTLKVPLPPTTTIVKSSKSTTATTTTVPKIDTKMKEIDCVPCPPKKKDCVPCVPKRKPLQKNNYNTFDADADEDNNLVSFDDQINKSEEKPSINSSWYIILLFTLIIAIIVVYSLNKN